MSTELQNIKLAAFGDAKLNINMWIAANAKASILVVHGMCEHSGRYTRFGKHFAENGYNVLTFDMRNHGLSCNAEQLGAPHGNHFLLTMQDVAALADYLRSEYKLPVYIFAHSYGTSIMQRFIQEYPDKADKVCLSGSSYFGGLLISFGAFLARSVCFFGGKHKKAKLLDKLSFGEYSKKYVKNGEAPLAWLTPDIDEIEKWDKDELRVKFVTYSFYRHFMQGVRKAYKKQNLAKLNKNLPLFLVSGTDDGVGGKNAALVKKLFDTYKNSGLSNVSLKLYENGRHELLNTASMRQQVFADVLEFFNS